VGADLAAVAFFGYGRSNPLAIRSCGPCGHERWLTILRLGGMGRVGVMVGLCRVNRPMRTLGSIDYSRFLWFSENNSG
jgi:hypothetical protein